METGICSNCKRDKSLNRWRRKGNTASIFCVNINSVEVHACPRKSILSPLGKIRFSYANSAVSKENELS